MKVEQLQWTEKSGWSGGTGNSLRSAQLLLVFDGSPRGQSTRLIQELRGRYPAAFFLGCTTAGEIQGTSVRDSSICATAIEFASSTLRTAQAGCAESARSFEVGQELCRQLGPQGLRHVLVLSNGLTVNGSELVRGMAATLPPGTSITGGLAGDGGAFKETWVIAGEAVASDLVAVVGLYGERLHVAYGSLGGWDPFGPDRCAPYSR